MFWKISAKMLRSETQVVNSVNESPLESCRVPDLAGLNPQNDKLSYGRIQKQWDANVSARGIVLKAVITSGIA